MDVTTCVLGVAGLVGLCGTACALVRTDRQSNRREASSSIRDPRSSVRLLKTDDELHEALKRALGYDHDAEDVLQRRTDRYAESGKEPSAPVIDLPRHGPDTAVASTERMETA
jgi:hypothetical protein